MSMELCLHQGFKRGFEDRKLAAAASSVERINDDSSRLVLYETLLSYESYIGLDMKRTFVPEI